jgi:hypothetical protein
MTADDFIALVPQGDRDLIQGVVLVLDTLRMMDEERLNIILSQAKLASTIAPKEIMGGVESMISDFTLILAFIEQAKKYDLSHRIRGGEK